jgi:ABC-type antimicrobial peptide transport system permease subunit
MKTKAFSETFSLSWSAIKASPLRTVLTSLIISFGIMALVGILSATDALKQSLESNFTSLGANTLTLRNSQGGFFAGGANRRQNPAISYRQAKAFKDRMAFAQPVQALPMSQVAQNSSAMATPVPIRTIWLLRRTKTIYTLEDLNWLKDETSQPMMSTREKLRHLRG